MSSHRQWSIKEFSKILPEVSGVQARLRLLPVEKAGTPNGYRVVLSRWGESLVS